MRCPVCQSREVITKKYNFHSHLKERTIPWRVDVTMKCCDCAAVWLHGVALSEDDFRRWVPEYRKGRTVERPEVRRLLNETPLKEETTK